MLGWVQATKGRLARKKTSTRCIIAWIWIMRGDLSSYGGVLPVDPINFKLGALIYLQMAALLQGRLIMSSLLFTKRPLFALFLPVWGVVYLPCYISTSKKTHIEYAVVAASYGVLTTRCKITGIKSSLVSFVCSSNQSDWVFLFFVILNDSILFWLDFFQIWRHACHKKK